MTSSPTSRLAIVALALPALMSLSSSQSHAFGRKATADNPCPKIQVLRAADLDLSDTELRLLCGDDGSDRIGRAWKDIPPAQVRSHFENFLQDRGYFYPTFRPLENGVLELDPGPPSRVREIRGENLPPEIPWESYRAPRGKALTPGRVNETAAWVKRRLQESGYPCPELEARGFPDEGRIVVRWLNPGPRATILDVRTELQANGTPASGGGAIRRFDAFRLGGPYSLILTEITGRRSSESKFAFSHDLSPECPLGPGVHLLESSQSGPPRLITLGASVNSEVGPEGRASWTHARLGRAGSSAEIAVNGSLKEQLGRAELHWYYGELGSRDRLSPTASFSHQNERRYELLALRTGVHWETGGEWDQGAWTAGFGPAWQNLQQPQGIGPLNRKFLSLNLNATYQSHRFEYFARNPKEGQQISVSALAVPNSMPGAGRPLAFQISQTWLISPGRADPPWVVLGLRSRAFATLLPAGTLTRNVPIDFRRWVGGGQDLRGFGREELPDQGEGARQGLTFGTEVRLPGLLPASIDPIGIVDGAWLRSGPSTSRETTQFFWDAGVGLRWGSPVGAVRSTLAHGFDVRNPGSHLSHWQGYLSLGEEF